MDDRWGGFTVWFGGGGASSTGFLFVVRIAAVMRIDAVMVFMFLTVTHFIYLFRILIYFNRFIYAFVVRINLIKN